MVEERKRPCPPPYVRDVLGRCVLPGSPFPGSVAPFGGPASGLFPSGSGGAGPGVQNCLRASISGDCFEGCDPSGMSCGWTILSGPGTVTFTGTNVILGPSGPDFQGVIAKSGVGPAPIRNLTYRFTLTEINAPATVNKTYITGITDAAGNLFFLVGLVGDGTIIILVGNGDGTGNFYTGTWTPIPGATRVVQATVDGAGLPSLVIDGVDIPLSFVGPAALTFLPSSIGVNIQNADFDGQGAFDNLFVTVGNVPFTTVFCCP